MSALRERRMTEKATVIGAGLAGCEAAYQLAKRGVPVRLCEMKPKEFSPAHKLADLAELVCSNSLRSDSIENAVGLLKEELRALGSLILSCADRTKVPAGGALAVDREGFSRLVTETIVNEPLIELVSERTDSIPEGNAIVATGPLTDGELLSDIERVTGTSLHFYDAAAPIVTKASLDTDKVFSLSRYDRGSDYLNCPMSREEYFSFVNELVKAETAPLHSFETPRVFEGCMPVEVMAKRGVMTLAYGPLKPVGLVDPRTGRQPFAVVQLRRDNEADTLYNIVGFQTNLKFAEQKRVFGMIPGLQHAEYVRYGVMHRNSYLESPGRLSPCYELRTRKGLFFAGQLTGVEGYVESASSGFIAGVSLAKRMRGEEPQDFGRETAIGSLGHYVSEYNGSDFQPMNVTYGIMEPLSIKIKAKRERSRAYAERSLRLIKNMIDKGEI